ncbi:Alkali-sensitive linkage protein 1 [Colletotrichum orbiculare MAFF 240422]|uniref:Alkali-sensitive linkage protein 1 n=1 Tax=Colletotrichum orbiculare (strain 104-T / ATCC 96160 / CBS 514.97 / LARS 414 / MAFF 240422) TaxID=1213857 RepID=A0A484FPE6_COLOR|nr:Alkali-sensitive linkage protein 1 [Colletotrichum orbiculare MAFF 240422]
MASAAAKNVGSKKCLLWDWTNTRHHPEAIDQLFSTCENGDSSATQLPFKSVHNWNAWCPPELKDRLPFRPMIRTQAQLGTEEWTRIRDSAADVVHYLNEPERQRISPTEAATWWAEQVVPELRLQQGKQLVGPACANDKAGGDWLAEFMDIVSRQRETVPDLLGVHYYGESVEHAKRYLTSMYEKYGLPLNVSEMASISRDGEQVARFTEETSQWMDGQEWIDEYGWFGCMAKCADGFVSPAAQLMDDKGRFTPLMRRLMEF